MVAKRRLDDTAEFLTTKDAAATLKLSPRTVARMVRSGALPAYRLPSGTVRIARADLTRTLDSWRRK
jgi:excisionase family DNA binding protein